MHPVTQRKTPTPDPPAANEDVPATRVPVAVRVNDRLVCVEIVDAPPPHMGAGICHCPACHGARYADLADRFYPDK